MCTDKYMVARRPAFAPNRRTRGFSSVAGGIQQEINRLESEGMTRDW